MYVQQSRQQMHTENISSENSQESVKKKYIINTENLPLTGSLYYFAESFCI